MFVWSSKLVLLPWNKFWLSHRKQSLVLIAIVPKIDFSRDLTANCTQNKRKRTQRSLYFYKYKKTRSHQIKKESSDLTNLKKGTVIFYVYWCRLLQLIKSRRTIGNSNMIFYAQWSHWRILVKLSIYFLMKK